MPIQAWGKGPLMSFVVLSYFFKPYSEKGLVLVVLGIQKWMKQNAKMAEFEIFIVFIWQLQAWSEKIRLQYKIAEICLSKSDVFF